MKKRNLKSLILNKKSISHLNSSIHGGIDLYDSTHCSIDICREIDYTGPYVDSCYVCESETCYYNSNCWYSCPKPCIIIDPGEDS